MEDKLFECRVKLEIIMLNKMKKGFTPAIMLEVMRDRGVISNREFDELEDIRVRLNELSDKLRSGEATEEEFTEIMTTLEWYE